MKLLFDGHEDYDLLWQSVHDSILYWKRVKFDIKSGLKTHYSTDYCDDQIKSYLELLVKIEDTEHEEWNGTEYVTVKNPDYHSAMVETNRKYLA